MNTLELLNSYIEKGWKIFPLKANDKVPLTEHGFKDASNDRSIIETWFKECPNCNWGISLGDSDLTVIDVDIRNGGELEVKETSYIIQSGNYSYSLPVTRLVKTGGGGYHLYYKGAQKLPKNLAPGLDLKSIGGYAVIPPSIHNSGNSYEWLNDKEIAILPENLKVVKDEKHFQFTPASYTEDIKTAIWCMSVLSKHRVDNYDEWIKVGMTLKRYGEIGLQLWDEWSRKSDKYQIGDCASKWETFSEEGITLGSLKYWAEEDAPKDVTPAPRNATPADYRLALKQLGYNFKLNVANNEIIVNGIPMDDIFSAVIVYNLKVRDYTAERNAELAWTYEAYENKFHPIVDYLDSLKWDGEDHIAKLCSYFDDIQGVFPKWLKRWLIGAVAKVLANPKGQQNRMLILDGRQDLGKSYFVRWLARGVPGYHIEAPIDPEDKDSWIRLMSKWIWEVSELGSTVNKADREALKNFLTTENPTVRKSYGHFDTERPALSNFIGTVNNEVGFLNDPTGSRRFMSCTLTKMDWNYSKEVDVNQVWAQAKYLFESGEPFELTKEEKELANEINTTYEVESPLAQYVVRYFDVDPSRTDWIMPTSEIIDILKSKQAVSFDTIAVTRNVTNALAGLKLEKSVKRIKGYSKTVRCWIGIKEKVSEDEIKTRSLVNDLFEGRLAPIGK